MCLLFFIDSKKQKIILMAKQTESYIAGRKYVYWLLKWKLVNMLEAAVWVMTGDVRWGYCKKQVCRSTSDPAVAEIENCA
jgi:hypothetical protein